MLAKLYMFLKILRLICCSFCVIFCGCSQLFCKYSEFFSFKENKKKRSRKTMYFRLNPKQIFCCFANIVCLRRAQSLETDSIFLCLHLYYRCYLDHCRHFCCHCFECIICRLLLETLVWRGAVRVSTYGNEMRTSFVRSVRNWFYFVILGFF